LVSSAALVSPLDALRNEPPVIHHYENMKWMVVVMVVFGAGCIISPIIPIGGNGKSSRERQHDTLSTLLPAQLTAQARWTGEVRVAKLRVWADDEYRAQNLRWEHGFDEELDDANQVRL
jgi:hypothetical protein